MSLWEQRKPLSPKTQTVVQRVGEGRSRVLGDLAVGSGILGGDVPCLGLRTGLMWMVDEGVSARGSWPGGGSLSLPLRKVEQA